MVSGFEGELIAEYAAPNGVNPTPASPTREYAYRAGEMLIQADAQDCKWLVSDHLGSPRIIIGKSGSLVDTKRRDFIPFGEDLGAGQFGRTTALGYEPSGTPSNPREKFATYERDDETGLDFAQARYYQNKLGRFTTPDEFAGGPEELFTLGSGDGEKQALPYAEITDPQTLNKYQYCLNNPLRYNDPTGHQQEGGPIDRIVSSLTELLNAAGRKVESVVKGTEGNGQPSSGRPGPYGNSDEVIINYANENSKAIYNASQVLSAVDPTGTGELATAVMLGDKSRMAVAAGGMLFGAFGRVGRLGFVGSKSVNEAVKVIQAGGDIAEVAGKTLTRNEAEKLIGLAGGTVRRVENGKNATVSIHTKPHINYTVGKSKEVHTVQVESVGKQFFRDRKKFHHR